MILVVATRNAHKTAEIAAMLPAWTVRDLRDFPSAPHVDETGSTFEQNATLKAVSASKSIPGIILADDSGLEVDALDGQPGVWSSSFGGEEGNHARNNARLVSELEARGLAESPARFRCVMVLARDGQPLAAVSGSVEGKVSVSATGKDGFGYDPHFIPAGYTESFAALGSDIKNSLSHRANALKEAIAFLQTQS